MRIRSRRFSWFLALSLFLLPVTAAAWSGKVIGVIDGDSITVHHEGRGGIIRLWGIEWPEKNPDFVAKATHASCIVIFAKMVEVEAVTRDRYGLAVAFVRIADILGNEDSLR